MSDYENDKFSDDSQDKNNGAASDSLYNLKLSVDLRSVKNMKVSGNAFVKFTLNLGVGKGSNTQFH